MSWFELLNQEESSYYEGIPHNQPMSWETPHFKVVFYNSPIYQRKQNVSPRHLWSSNDCWRLSLWSSNYFRRAWCNFGRKNELLSIACHVRIQVCLFIHSNFLGPLGPQALLQSEVHRTWLDWSKYLLADNIFKNKIPKAQSIWSDVFQHGGQSLVVKGK